MAELLTGRARKFRLERLAEVVERAVSLRPDHVLITGDLTTTALRSEFEQAREALEPLARRPGLRATVIPGNHDRYTSRLGPDPGLRADLRRIRPLDRVSLAPLARRPDGDPRPRRDPLAPLGDRAGCRTQQFQAARALLETGRPADAADRRLPLPGRGAGALPRELRKKRMVNAAEVAALAGRARAAPLLLRPRPRGLGLPPRGDPRPALPERRGPAAPRPDRPTAARVPGDRPADEAISVQHHAWTGTDWSILPMVEGLRHYERARRRRPGLAALSGASARRSQPPEARTPATRSRARARAWAFSFSASSESLAARRALAAAELGPGGLDVDPLGGDRTAGQHGDHVVADLGEAAVDEVAAGVAGRP